MTENKANVIDLIERGDATLGIEFGSTRIKAVLIDADSNTIATGIHDWESTLSDGLWSYSLDQVHLGMQDAYASLKADVAQRYGAELRSVAFAGVSAMMHGYLAFDKEGELLVPFRTWRNTNTGDASAELSELLGANIPLRWSVAHLYQAILNGEEHVGKIDFLTTLAGYVHWELTGEKVLGVGDAAGMFPIDSTTLTWDQGRVGQFEELIADRELPWTFDKILPEVLPAGRSGGTLTEDGARLLDPSGDLAPGTVLCPPEGDAGTGMVATNAVAERTGNVSVGTSIFSMVVLDKPWTANFHEIDIVTTPDGKPVAMVHCNNGTGELDAWIRIFTEFAQGLGVEIDKSKAYALAYESATSDGVARDGGGAVGFNYLAGEPITGLDEGRPLFARVPGEPFSLANFVRTQLMSMFASLRIGTEILESEGVEIDTLVGHGGVFNTPRVAQTILSAALDTPIAVGSQAGEGGAWGIALLARYCDEAYSGLSLSEYLDQTAFADVDDVAIIADREDVEAYNAFIERYRAAIAVQKSAVDSLS